MFYAIVLLLISISLLGVEVGSSSVAGQETLLGIVGRDFIVLGADSSVSTSISLTSSVVDKIKVIVNPFPHGQDKEKRESGVHINTHDDMQQQIIAVASAGDAADSERLISHLASHTSSMEYRYLGCDVKCIFHGDYKGRGIGIPVAGTLSPAGLDAESVAYLARGLIASSLRSRGQLKTCLLVAGMVRCYQNSECEMLDIVNHHTEKSMGIGGQLEYFDSSSFAQRLQHQTESYCKIQNPSNYSAGDNQRWDNSQHLAENHSKSTTLKPKLFWLDEYGSLQNVEYGAHGLASNFALSILDRRYHPNLSRAAAVDLVVDCFRQLRKRFVINSPELPCIKCIDAEGCKVITLPPSKMSNNAY